MVKRWGAASALVGAANRGTAGRAVWPRRDDRGEKRNGWFASLRACFLDDLEKRGTLADLDPAEILEWADAYRARTGNWPVHSSGPIPEAPGETWLAVEAALAFGLRGLPGRSTIVRLLADNRRRYHPRDLRLTVPKILAWADDWHDRTGAWPIAGAGEIPDAADITWDVIDRALRYGRSGLPTGSSLSRLLAQERGVRHLQDLPKFDIPTILLWADAHHARTGDWPKRTSGQILEVPDETWVRVDTALSRGIRGLPGGSSLALLLGACRGVRYTQHLPPLTEQQVLAWADLFHARTGKWPNAQSGPIAEASGEKWRDVQNALRSGLRGLPGGSSLPRLLLERRGVRNENRPPALTTFQILGWADAHRARTGHWPTLNSGPVAEAPGESWGAISQALRKALRGLPGGFSLADLLERERGSRNAGNLPRFQVPEILSWADAHRARNGKWPTLSSGPIPEAPGETWERVHVALYRGLRGLPGGSSLSRLLAAERNARTPDAAPGQWVAA